MIAGRYELQEQIGAGGEARVYRARDTQLSCDVALRLVRDSHAPVQVPALPLQHHSWVKLLRTGTDPEQGSFLVFELLRGRTLRMIIEQQPLSLESWRHFVSLSLDSLEALHEAGWIHDDLNADNFFHTEDADWKLLELPFHRPKPASKPLFGSIYTLAPEQFEGQPPNAASNLYALGCLYYYAATGHYPHAGATTQDIAIGRLRFPPAPLAESAPHLSTTFTHFVMHLLARDPGDRPPNAAAARQLLARA